MRLYPPTAGMSTTRFVAQVILVLIFGAIVRAVCFVFGHKPGPVIDIREHRWIYCERCQKQLKYWREA